MRIRLHNQWTKTYSWHHKFVYDSVILYWLVVCFVFLFFLLCFLIIVRYYMSLFAAVYVNLIYRVRWSVVASVQSKMFVLQYAVFLSSKWLYSGPYVVIVFSARCKTGVLWCWCPRCAGWYLACEISRQNPALEAWQCEELAMFINM